MLLSLPYTRVYAPNAAAKEPPMKKTTASKAKFKRGKENQPRTQAQMKPKQPGTLYKCALHV